MIVKILPTVPSLKDAPRGKLADVELHFTEAEGALIGLRLLGFAIWERRSGTGLNVTFPSRTYSVNGERRSFSLLRPISDSSTAQKFMSELILRAYKEFKSKEVNAVVSNV